MNSGGDVLARGGKSATFGGPKVSQQKWDAAFGVEAKPTGNKKKSKRLKSE